jgi:phage gp37-like protein
MIEARIVETEAALVELIRKSLGDVQDVAGITAEDFNKDDQVVTSAPAIRVWFMAEMLSGGKDLKALIYDSTQTFVVLAGAQDLSTQKSERGAAQLLTGRICEQLAGARLAVTSVPLRALIDLKSVRLFQISPEGTWYAIEIGVRNSFAFSGPNAV